MDRVEFWLKQINKMLDSERYTRQEDILFDVGEWVEENNHITDKQIELIKKIKTGN